MVSKIGAATRLLSHQEQRSATRGGEIVSFFWESSAEEEPLRDGEYSDTRFGESFLRSEPVPCRCRLVIGSGE
jgi:hypothetical protein